MNIELFKLPNVHIDARYEADAIKSGMPIQPVNADLGELLTKCAMKYPLWKFIAREARLSGSSVYTNHFDVMSMGDVLGRISSRYVRGRTCLVIDNHRIIAARERGQAYATADVSKAFAAVRKSFGRKSAAELMSDALSSAAAHLNQAGYVAQQAVGGAETKHKQALMAFAMRPDIYAQFLAYAEKHDAVRETLINVDEARVQMKTIAEVRAAYNNGTSHLVVKDNEEYIVRTQSNVEIYTDTTLPHDLRAKLGLLKLVDAGKAVEGFGYRVSDEVYVVLPGDNNNE